MVWWIMCGLCRNKTACCNVMRNALYVNYIFLAIYYPYQKDLRCKNVSKSPRWKRCEIKVNSQLRLPVVDKKNILVTRLQTLFFSSQYFEALSSFYQNFDKRRHWLPFSFYNFSSWPLLVGHYRGECIAGNISVREWSRG